MFNTIIILWLLVSKFLKNCITAYTVVTLKLELLYGFARRITQDQISFKSLKTIGSRGLTSNWLLDIVMADDLMHPGNMWNTLISTLFC